MFVLYLIMALPIPLLMILLGHSWMQHPPEEVDQYWGYRTRMSKKNQMTWKFAHKYVSRIWFWVGIPLLIASIAISLFFMNSTYGVQDIIAAVVFCCQIAGMLLPVIPTEQALRKNFDQYGMPK